MTEQLSRSFPELTVRADGTGRTIGGLVVPYNRAARVSDGGPAYDEMFVQGSTTRTIQHRGDRIKLLSQHNSRSNPLGVAVRDSWRETPDGLYGEFKVSRTAAGDEALELVRDGALDSFSIGFTPIKHEKRDGVTVRTEVALREVSLVTFPAYDDARISTVRDATAADLIARGYTPESVERALNEGDIAHLVWSGIQPTSLIPATTADERSEQTATPVEDPASATPDALTRFRHLRHIAREKGII
jgi:HK97 family phage prohead protease